MHRDHLTGSATARAGVNIALVKYWGKRDVAANLPAVGSISFTLEGLDTHTTVHFDSSLDEDQFTLDGIERDDPRVRSVLSDVRRTAAIHTKALVTSTNGVPTASGLASSASGFAALTLAAWSAAGLATTDLHQHAPFLDIVRRGSGSAPRSLLGGLVELHRDNGHLETLCNPSDWSLRMIVCRLTKAPKKILSRDGMQHTANTSTYYSAWVNEHPVDLRAGRAAIKARDLSALGPIMERSTMRMHACMLAADPPLRYLRGISLEVMDRVEALRAQGIGAWYTMDAGPHVKVLCDAPDLDDVLAALRELVDASDLLVAAPGQGASLIES